jgi:hypothetical protein
LTLLNYRVTLIKVTSEQEQIKSPTKGGSMSAEQRTEIPGFGVYVLALFLTPVYYATRGKWFAFLVTGALYTGSFLTFIIIPLSMFLWMLAAVPACWGLRNEIMIAHAKRTGEETAAAMTRENDRVAQRS